MSVELEILPAKPSPSTWDEIATRLKMLLGSDAQKMIGDSPELLKLGEQTVVPAHEQVKSDEHYYFSLATPNTLGLSVFPNEDESVELEYLRDMNGHLKESTIQQIAKDWDEAGYFYGLTSMGGRSQQEPKLFVALATALAEISKGVVVVMDHGLFNLDVGIYTPEQFQLANPQF